MYDIVRYLEAAHGYEEACSEDIKKHVGVDLLDSNNSAFCERVQQNQSICISVVKGVLFAKRIAPLGVRDVSSLRDLFMVHIPSGNVLTSEGLRREAVSEKELASAYPGIEADMDAMIRNREVCRLEVGGENGAILAPCPTGQPVDPSLRELWQSIEIVPGSLKRNRSKSRI